MANTDFTRTIVTNTIKGAKVNIIEGVTTTEMLEDIIRVGKIALTPEKASKILQEIHKGETVVILKIETKEEVRGMDFETFLKHSSVVVRPASQQ